MNSMFHAGQRVRIVSHRFWPALAGSNATIVHIGHDAHPDSENISLACDIDGGSLWGVKDDDWLEAIDEPDDKFQSDGRLIRTYALKPYDGWRAWMLEVPGRWERHCTEPKPDMLEGAGNPL